jgi:hypothetical protein
MKDIFKLPLVLFFPFLTFSQWTKIVPYSQNAIIVSPITSEEITLIKTSDTVWFSDWKRDLKLFGLPNTSFTGEDFSVIDLIDSIKLEEAYNAACVGCPLKWPTTPQAAIELIEMNFLYRGYDNVFKLAASWPDGVKEYRIEATDATVKTRTLNNEIIHTINPKGKMTDIKVIYKDEEGVDKFFGPWVYRVSNIPDPVILSNKVSKTGGRINVVGTQMLIGMQFRVTSIEIGENKQVLEGNIIPSEVLKKIKVGKMIPITVKGLNIRTEDEFVINGSIEIVE